MFILNYKSFSENSSILERGRIYTTNLTQVRKMDKIDKEEIEYILQDIRDDFPYLNFEILYTPEKIVVNSKDIEVPILQYLIDRDLKHIQKGIRNSIIGKFAQKIKSSKTISDLHKKLDPYINEIEDRLKDIGLSISFQIKDFAPETSWAANGPVDVIKIRLHIW